MATRDAAADEGQPLVVVSGTDPSGHNEALESGPSGGEAVWLSMAVVAVRSGTYAPTQCFTHFSLSRHTIPRTHLRPNRPTILLTTHQNPPFMDTIAHGGD